MTQPFPTTMLPKIPKTIIIVTLLLVIAAAAILLSPSLPQELAASITALLLFAIITLLVYLVARSIGLKDQRSPRRKQATTLLCFGFASFFGYGALVVALMGHPFSFPVNLPLLLAVVLFAALTAVIADYASKKLGKY